MDFSQDELSAVLARIAGRRGGVYPAGAWDDIATLISLRDPERIEIAALRRFQAAVLEKTGLAPMVVGGVFGCVKLFVRLLAADDAADPPPTLRPVGAARSPAQAFAAALASDARLRSLALDAGFNRIQTADTSINLRTGRPEAYGFGRQPLDLPPARPELARFRHEATVGYSSPVARLTQPRATPTPTAQEAFHFLLHGDDAGGNAIVAKTTAQLVFDYAVPPDDAIATVIGSRLESARQADIDILLVPTTRGPLSVGAGRGVAQFSAGRLRNPVVFELLAGAEKGDASVHVAFHARGELIHETEIAIRVVAELPRSPDAFGAADTKGMAPPTLGQLAQGISAPPAQKINVSLSFADEKLRLELSDYKYGDRDFHQVYQSTRLTPVSISTMLSRIQVDLKDCYADLDFWSEFDGTLPSGSEASFAVAALEETLEKVAIAGSRLDEDLRDDAEIAKALAYIEANAITGAVLNFTTDNTFLPWEILYPKHRSANMGAAARASQPVDRGAFWGVRFAIETEMRGIGSALKMRDEHIGRPPKVTMNLNPSISIRGVPATSQPIQVQKDWGGALKHLGVVDDINDSCEDIMPVVRDAAGNATLIYVYCHGNAADALSGIDELLLLGTPCQLSPRDLRTLPDYVGAPIIFLNSCKAGISSPLNFSGFLKEYRDRNVLGMIATSYSVPIAFGAAFGGEVVRAYLDREGSLAAAMLELRRAHLLGNGDPVPLFYTLQCHLDVPAKDVAQRFHAA